MANMKRTVKKVKAWAVVSDNDEYIGSGQRGRMYFYWDEKEAYEYVSVCEDNVKHAIQKRLNWKVVPVTISFTLPKKSP